MQYVKVMLRGLTVCARVWNEGELIPFTDLPKPVQKMVKAGKHPHLKIVKADAEEAVASDAKEASEDHADSEE